MTTLTTEETGAAQATAAAEKPKAGKNARVAPRRANVATKKGTSAKKASPAKKAPKGHKKEGAARDGSKTAKILALLKRPGGASLQQLQKATGWQAHSVRGFLSGTLKKKMGLRVHSAKLPDGRRTYRVTSK